VNNPDRTGIWISQAVALKLLLIVDLVIGIVAHKLGLF
jgi:hypothetical protein